mgnify:CR=1 FL=1
MVRKLCYCMQSSSSSSPRWVGTISFSCRPCHRERHGWVIKCASLWSLGKMGHLLPCFWPFTVMMSNSVHHDSNVIEKCLKLLDGVLSFTFWMTQLTRFLSHYKQGFSRETRWCWFIACEHVNWEKPIRHLRICCQAPRKSIAVWDGMELNKVINVGLLMKTWCKATEQAAKLQKVHLESFQMTDKREINDVVQKMLSSFEKNQTSGVQPILKHFWGTEMRRSKEKCSVWVQNLGDDTIQQHRMILDSSWVSHRQVIHHQQLKQRMSLSGSQACQCASLWSKMWPWKQTHFFLNSREQGLHLNFTFKLSCSAVSMEDRTKMWQSHILPHC